MKRSLFESIVLAKLAVTRDRAEFRVVGRADNAETAVMIEQPRPGDRNRYWDHPVTRLRAGEAVLKFLDYFDFDQIGILDFRFVRVQIAECPEHRDLVGREALVEASDVKVLFRAAPVNSPAAHR